MEDLLQWLIKARKTAVLPRVFSPSGRAIVAIPGGAIPRTFLDEEIARLKVEAKEATARKRVYALLPAAGERETR